MVTESNNGQYLGVDLGGTNIEVAAVKDGKILASKKINTKADKGAEKVIDRIEKAVRSVVEKLDSSLADFDALCVGAPGAVELRTGIVSDAPNLEWINVPLGQSLQDRLGLTVFVDNDVNVGVLGEYVYGAGKGAQDMVGVFVGTGIGGGIIINGNLHHGGRGAAGEIGHMVIVPEGRVCGCGRQGCVEAYASKTAMMDMILDEVKKGRKSKVTELISKKGPPILTSGAVDIALQKGDQVMTEVLTSAQYYLGLLTANLVNTLDPDVIVFGGGIVEQLGEPFLVPVRQTARKHYLQQKDAEKVRIVTSSLGDHAGTIGAAVTAQRRLES
jgi:glucokinase